MLAELRTKAQIKTGKRTFKNNKKLFTELDN